MRDFESPLKAWPGQFSLPEPDEFTGTMWRMWSSAVDKPKRSSYASTHLFGYCGLELIKRFGEWKVDAPLGEVQAWEDNPDEERTKLIAWIGREVRRYIIGVIDPKE